MIYALCEKLWQHNFTIAIVVKLLINGLCWEKFNEKLLFKSAFNVLCYIYIQSRYLKVTSQKLNSIHIMVDNFANNFKVQLCYGSVQLFHHILSCMFCTVCTSSLHQIVCKGPLRKNKRVSK